MTRSLSSAAVQTDVPRSANRLWTEDSEQTMPGGELKQLQDEINFAKNEIARIKQAAQKEKTQLMKKIADEKGE